MSEQQAQQKPNKTKSILHLLNIYSRHQQARPTPPGILLHSTAEDGMGAFAERHTNFTVHTGEEEAIGNPFCAFSCSGKVTHVLYSLLVYIAIALDGKGIEGEALFTVRGKCIALAALAIAAALPGV